MTVELTPEHQRIIERVMDSCGYKDAGDVISAALNALVEEAGDRAVQEREAAIEQLKTFGSAQGLSLGGISLRELRHEARP